MADSLSTLSLVNRFAGLPADYWSRVQAEPLAAPRLVHFNAPLAARIGFGAGAATDPGFLAVMSGNAPLPGGTSISSVYAGHQFGVFVPQLGDGRALLIGQASNEAGELWELQLKEIGRAHV